MAPLENTMTEVRNGVYGIIPNDLVPVPAGAGQFSPLLVGSHALEELAPLSLDGFTMLAPPGTIERHSALALALRALIPGAPLTALAPKDKGGSRLAKELKMFSGGAVEEDSRSHHRLCAVKRPVALQGIDEAISAGAPRFLPDLQLWTQPGVFSWDRFDPGSTLLLECAPAFSGKGADLGCGIGYLANTVLTQSPQVTELTLVDIDRRAIECAKKNVPDPRSKFLWADLRAADTGLANLDFIVTNPPFHDTGLEDQSLGRRFLEQSAQLLRQGGLCWLVANRHLPYETLLKTLFSSVRLVAEKNGFKLYEARR